MNKALAQARSYGITIELADLGEWGFDELRSEYDPAGPTIRVNARVLETLSLQELGEYLTFAIGHELYHHREHLGEVQRDPNRAAREAAANAYARALVAES
jgi:hypothetical protein